MIPIRIGYRALLSTQIVAAGMAVAAPPAHAGYRTVTIASFASVHTSPRAGRQYIDAWGGAGNWECNANKMAQHRRR